MTEITPLQKRTLELFGKSPLAKIFYWTGGTALSVFYFHHRQSKDLDFFSEQPFSYEKIIGFIHSLKGNLELSKIEEKKIFDRFEFFLTDKEKLRLEFVYFEHPRLKPRKKWQGISTDSLEDIAANKVMALFDRTDPKDLVDIYFILTKFQPEKLLKLVEKKFGISITKSSLWSESQKSLKNLDEITPLLITKAKNQRRKIVQEIKNYFEAKGAQYLYKILR
ncbi:MAG: nucleotidyl transferase AbiEii/AbiGii toxin family protein [Patescibacteria group bacterium]|nr:nucleotidyl transferase AbiEii/AbiGii toxin family protein [Patescibacteria group bacterium]